MPWVMSGIYGAIMSHVSYIWCYHEGRVNESCGIRIQICAGNKGAWGVSEAWVMSRINESCLACVSYVSYTWCCHEGKVNESWLLHVRHDSFMWDVPRTNTSCCVCMNHVLNVYESCPGATRWLRLVGSTNLQVSFAEYSLFYRALLQKRSIIWSISLTEATPYDEGRVKELWLVWMSHVSCEWVMSHVHSTITSERCVRGVGVACVLCAWVSCPPCVCVQVCVCVVWCFVCVLCEAVCVRRCVCATLVCHASCACVRVRVSACVREQSACECPQIVCATIRQQICVGNNLSAP